MKYFTIFLITSILTFSSCGNSPVTEAPTKVAPSSAETNVPTEILPSIPLPTMQKLFDECDYVDYLFYETNFSMSMNNKGSIQSTLTHISENVPVLNKPCKSIGRVFYEINGNTEIEAEIYFSEECKYFVFMKDNKRIYANNLTPDGIAHFNNLFKKASQMNK